MPIIIQRDYQKTHAQPLESSNVHVLPEGKIPNWNGIGEIKGDQVLTKECDQAILVMKENHTWMSEEEEKEKVEALEMVDLVNGEPTKTMKIRMNLNDQMKKKLVQFPKENLDIFAWRHKNR